MQTIPEGWAEYGSRTGAYIYCPPDGEYYLILEQDGYEQGLWHGECYLSLPLECGLVPPLVVKHAWRGSQPPFTAALGWRSQLFTALFGWTSALKESCHAD